MNRTEYLYLMQHAEKEIDSTVCSLEQVQDRRLKFAVKRLLELSHELNTRVNHLNKEVMGKSG